MWSLGGALGLAALVALGLPLIGNIGRFKPRLEAVASDALGMDVRVAGPLTIGIFPVPHLLANDLRIFGDANTRVASIERARIDFAPLPLLLGRLRLSRIGLSRPHVFIVRAQDRQLNVARLRHAMASAGALDGARISVSDGSVEYSDRASAARFGATGVDLDVGGFEARGADPSLRQGIALRATVSCRELRSQRLAISAVRFVVSVRDGKVEGSPMTLRVFGGRATGHFTADLTGPIPSYHLTCALRRFRVERFPGNASAARRLVGPMDFSAVLSMRGRTVAELIPNLAGELSLRGVNLMLEGSDIDRTFAHYQSSRNFNFVDLGAVFFAGPAGLAVTRGYGFAGLFEGNGGSSRIGTLVSDWTLDHGMARVKDVAMATAANRIALQGSLDLVHERFENVTLAVIDAGGCARLRQTVRGDFAHPVVEKPKLLGSLTGPAVGLYRRARRWFPEKPCTPFYSGVVRAPL